MPAVVSSFTGRKTVTIANTGTTSTAIDTGSATKICIHFPTITASAAMTLHASDAIDGTFQALYAGATAISIDASTGARAVMVDIGAARFIKIVLAAQGALRTIPVDLGR